MPQEEGGGRVGGAGQHNVLQIKEPGTQIGNLFKFYARQRQKRRVLSRAPVDHEIRVQEEWEEGGCCCCSSARTATVAASQPELTTQSCHSTVLHATDSGRLGEKLMKSHKSQTSGTLCIFYELLLCSAVLCCAVLQAAFNAVGPRQSPQI